MHHRPRSTRFIPVTGAATAFAAMFVFAVSIPAQEAESSAEASEEPGFELSLDIHEWPVPWQQTRPRDPAKGPDGTVWFVGQQGDYVARLDPESGEMERFALPDGAGPHNVIVDAEGYPWYAGNRDAHIGRLDPETGEITRYDMPEGVNDPHTLIWNSEGDIWFTVQRSGSAGFVGKFSPASGDVRVVEVPGNGMRPYGIVVDSNDRPWIAFLGSNAIGTVDPETFELEIIRTPDEGSRIRRIAVTSDDRIWWVDAARGFLGVYDPTEESMNQWPGPGGERTGLYAMTSDAEDRVWFVESNPNPNRFVGFDTNAEEFVAITEVPSGGGSIRHMVFDPETNAIWFGTDVHTIGRATVP